MPTGHPACREAGGCPSNRAVGAPWIEPASRSASEPTSASLHQSRAANLSEKPKPATRREAMFTSSGGAFRGERGQRAGKVGLGRLGGPCRRLRDERDEACAESIRRASVAGESERPIVCARQRANQVGGSPTRPATPGRYPKVGVTAHWPGTADKEETERTQLWKRRDNGAGDSQVGRLEGAFESAPTGGQGVRREAESEGHAENRRAVIEGREPVMNRSAEDREWSSPHYGGEGTWVPPCRTKVCADGTA